MFNRKQIVFRWLQVIVCLVSIGTFLQCKVREKPEGLKDRLAELCKIIPPDFQEIRSPRTITKYEGGTYSIGFSSNMTYAEVKTFYSTRLLTDKWEVREHSSYNISNQDETKYLTYQKDGYDIEIETSNLNNDDSKKAFFVTCGWQ